MRTLAKEPGRETVEAVSADLLALPEVTQPADVLWLHLFYHDLHTALIRARGATAADFNRAVYELLKPGGSYVIVDHAAAAGTRSEEHTSELQSLMRISYAVFCMKIKDCFTVSTHRYGLSSRLTLMFIICMVAL